MKASNKLISRLNIAEERFCELDTESKRVNKKE